MSAPLQITRGRALALRIFDIADEIDLRRAEQLVQSLSRRPTFVRSAQQVRLPHPPLEMALGTRPSPLPEAKGCEVFVRIYDVGALAVTFSLELPTPTTPDALLTFANHLLAATDAITAAAQTISTEIHAAIKSACKSAQVSPAVEDYTMFRIFATDPYVDADELKEQLDVPRLLLGETGPISARERASQSHAEFSYSPDELVVVDWNSALIYDPSPSYDVVDLLELTTMQLLELRAYDDLVARSLTSVYDELDNETRVLFQSTKYGRLSREIMQLFVDVTEMSERIEASLQILGDSWLARVHRAAVAEFDLPRWQRLLKDKLEVLRQINELVVDQITSEKSLRIEGAIVVLIVIELVFAVIRIV